MRKIMIALGLALGLTACGETRYVYTPVYTPVMSAEACHAWAGDWIVRSKGAVRRSHIYNNSYELGSLLSESKRLSASCYQYGYRT